jgi:hypothetical protein
MSDIRAIGFLTTSNHREFSQIPKSRGISEIQAHVEQRKSNNFMSPEVEDQILQFSSIMHIA